MAWNIGAAQASGWDIGAGQRSDAGNTYNETCADGVSNSDADQNIIELVASLSDGTVTADTCANVITMLGQLVAGLIASDVATEETSGVISVNCQDGTVYTDASQSQQLFSVAAVDGATLNDVLAAIAIYNKTAADGVIFSDLAIDSSQLAQGRVIIRATATPLTIDGSAIVLNIECESITVPKIEGDVL